MTIILKSPIWLSKSYFCL